MLGWWRTDSQQIQEKAALQESRTQLEVEALVLQLREEKSRVASLQDEVERYRGLGAERERKNNTTAHGLQTLQQADADSTAVFDTRTDDLAILHRQGGVLRWSATPASDVVRIVEKLDIEIRKCATNLTNHLPILDSQWDSPNSAGESSNHISTGTFSTVPYSGPQRKLVVGIDVGTTFSGVSYCILDPGVVPLVQGVNRCVPFLCMHFRSVSRLR